MGYWVDDLLKRGYTEIAEVCDCHDHAISLMVHADGVEEEWDCYFDVFFCIHPHAWSWRERLFYIWRILTGNVSAMWEVCLNKPKAVRIAEFILECAEVDGEGKNGTEG
jgi:hypothetical protein